MQKRKLSIVTPTRDGMLDINYVEALMGTTKQLPNGWDMMPTLLAGCSDITAARNTLWNKWYYETDVDAFAFIDSDMGWRPQDVNRALELLEMVEVDAVGGIYPKKGIDLDAFGKAIQAQMEQRGQVDMETALSASMDYTSTGGHNFYEEGYFKGLMQIDACGMGFFLITREKAKKLMDWAEANMEKRIFHTLGIEVGGYPVFNHLAKETGDNYGEDYSFCFRMKEAGMILYADPSMPFTHHGNHTFYGKFSDFFDTFKHLASNNPSE
jgi:hypothetical protein